MIKSRDFPLIIGVGPYNWEPTLRWQKALNYINVFTSFFHLSIFSTSPTGSENHLASFRFQNTFLLNV